MGLPGRSSPSRVFVSLLLLALCAPAAAQTLAYWERDAFDWMDAGTLAGRNGWTHVQGASLQVKAVGTTCGALAVPAAGGMIVKDVGAVGGFQELRFRVMAEAGGAALLDLEMPTGGRLLRFELGTTLRAISPNGTAVLVGQTTADHWYAIRARLDLDARRATIDVDGATVFAGLVLPGTSIRRLRLTGSPATGAIYLADIFGFPPPALPSLSAPDHTIGFGYFHTHSRWGDFRPQASPHTTLFRADAAAYPGAKDGDSAWIAPFEQSLYDAMLAGRGIVLALDQGRCPDDSAGGCHRLLETILGRAEPYWSFVDSIELADEPGWDRAETEARIADIRYRLTNRALPARPIGIVLGKDDLTVNQQVVQARGLDWVGIEAYREPPGLSDPSQEASALASDLAYTMSRIPTDKQIVLIVQGYDRNGAWTNEATLAALQAPPYQAAATNPRVRALLVFAYGRCGGTHAYPSLQVQHEGIAAALRQWNSPPDVALTSPAPGVRAPGSIRLAAAASDADGAVVRVEWYQGTSPVGSDTSAPFETSWTPPGDGVYQFFARAWDDRGAMSTSLPVLVQIGTLPRLDLSDATVTAPDGAGIARFTVTLAGTAGVPVTVDYKTADGTARAGREYLPASGHLTFLPGQIAHEIEVTTLPGIDDTFFMVQLANAVNAVARRWVGTGRIVIPVTAAVTVDDASVAEGHAGTSLLAFPVRLSAPDARTLAIGYSTEDGSAIAGRDYTARSGALMFEPGQTTRAVIVAVAGNTAVDGDRRLGLRLTSSAGPIARGLATGTILDDDPPVAATPVPVYRLYARNLTAEHLYTTDLRENQYLASTYDAARSTGWMAEGVAFRILGGPGPFAGVFGVPLFRLYNAATRQHHWTSDAGEVLVLANRAEWSFEGFMGYVGSTSSSSTTPLFRLSNGGALHLWTIEVQEKAVLTGTAGWIDEGSVGDVIR